ncbi:family 16 glycosylhydrolase [Nocardia sp. NPDC088792]|uniref:glycoside hydrolase family 16 protein n=1 Tax=Nocardia sp. NPDC088792 TaxID=3364332 RepID=UPI0037FC40B0
MNTTIARTAALAIITTILVAACATHENLEPGTASAARWRLIWSDEFNGPAGGRPDPARWVYDRGGEPQWGNEEWQYYTDRPANVATDGRGHLMLTARRERLPEMGACSYGSCDITSGRITTLGQFDRTYGRFAARMKIPDSAGMWPAFWMLGADMDTTPWPGNGEIDVMESVADEPGAVHGSAHGPGFADPGYTGSYKLPGGQRLSDDFHNYTVEWTPTRIDWFLDDNRYFTVTKDSLRTGERWPFDHPFYLLLNLAVGGTWPGPPDETTAFPSELLIDYVRVYDRAG